MRNGIRTWIGAEQPAARTSLTSAALFTRMRGHTHALISDITFDETPASEKALTANDVACFLD
jgi:hypothetical protein